MSSTLSGSDFKTQSYGFGAIPRTAEVSSSSVCVIPFAYDSTSSSTAAARKGPEAILRASRNLELFDSELGTETYKVGIQTMDEVVPNVNSPLENSQVVEAVVAEALDAGKLPVVIGGDHSLTLGAVRAALDKYPDIGVVILDAHPDLFDQYDGTKYGHASVARRIHELGAAVAIAGVRSASREESDFIKNSEISIVKAREILKSNEAIEGVLSSLPERIYLSIDLDVMDISPFAFCKSCKVLRKCCTILKPDGVRGAPFLTEDDKRRIEDYRGQSARSFDQREFDPESGEQLTSINIRAEGG